MRAERYALGITADESFRENSQLRPSLLGLSAIVFHLVERAGSIEERCAGLDNGYFHAFRYKTDISSNTNPD